MRATLIASAAGLALSLAGLAQAADTPNASQIINSLTPGSEMTTRGIHLGGQPPASSGMARPTSTQPSAVAHPTTTHSAAGSGEANLNVPFSSGSSEISPAAARVLDQLGIALTSAQLADSKFRIEGHTDTVGAADMNKTLSEQRANSVADYLANKYKVDRSRLQPVGMGEEGLLVTTGPNVASAANRRVLVVNLGK
jgi:outer membrane protein OmpA-like peptidoglycan-associated protein